jgi:uncharacterized membrane protein
LSKFRDLAARLILHLQRVFHLLVGVIFLVLAFAGASVALTEWRYYKHTPSVGLVRFGLLAAFTVFLVILGLYSFLKARSVR